MEGDAVLNPHGGDARVGEIQGAKAAVKVVLAGDDEIVRRGLQALLEKQPSIRLIGEAGDRFNTIKVVEELQPDVLVVDLTMYDMSLAATKYMVRQSPKTSIVVYSTENNESYVSEALRGGIKGYVLKGFAAAELTQAILEAAAGHHYLSRPLIEQAIEVYANSARSRKHDSDSLTSRERDVLQLVSRGLRNREIAKHLHISLRTVESHRLRVRRKLGLLGSRTTPLRYAAQRGLPNGR